MAFPTGWAARVASGVRSIRFYVSGTTTSDFADNAFIFAQDVGANTYVATPFLRPGDEKKVINIGPPPFGGGQRPEDANSSVPIGGPQAVPEPMIWSDTIRIFNDGAEDIEFSFDGDVVHGVIKAGEAPLAYRNRFEAGIAVRSAMGADYRIEAW